LRNVIALNVIRVVGNHVRAFSTWRTRIGSSNVICHLAGPCEKLGLPCMMGGIYVNSVQQLVTHQTGH